jgi:hypothetical protein
MKNEILEEIWRTRKELEEEVGGDLHELLKRAQRRTKESPRRKYTGSVRLRKAGSS